MKKAIYAMVDGDCDEVSLHILFRDLLKLHAKVIMSGRIRKEY